MLPFRILPWDSDLFGFPVGRIEAPDGRAEELPATLAALRGAGVRFASWAALPSPDRRAAALAAGGFLADRKRTYRAPPSPAAPAPRLEAWTPAMGDAGLEDLAIACGVFSRYAVDPRMPAGLFARLYRIWLRRSLAGEIADAVLVARDGARFAALATLKAEADGGSIGLLGVADADRGRGLGLELVRAALAWCAERKLPGCSVVTQGDNAPACRLYERGGFRMEREEEVFHFWPD